MKASNPQMMTHGNDIANNAVPDNKTPKIKLQIEIELAY